MNLEMKGDRNSPKGAVQSTSKFCGIAHESAFVSETSVDQAPFDILDTAIHHVTGSDTVSACFCIVDSDLCDASSRGSVVDGSVVIQEATVTVVGIFA